jgi:ribosomal-protein-alanine N-acetyltransferase
VSSALSGRERWQNSTAALAYDFGQANLERIIALTKPENTASRRVMEKLGMRYEKSLHIFHLDAVYYVITRDAWYRHPTEP